MLARLTRFCIPAFLILILSSTAFATAATNTVAPSSAGESYHTVSVEAFIPPECASLDLTSINIGGGTSGNDLILGTSGDDFILGGNGSDCIIGGGGDDFILAGGSDDIILGGAGSDIIFGGGGNDICLGQDNGALFIGCENTD